MTSLNDRAEDYYDYPERERRFREAVQGFVGKHLFYCRLQIVSLEINVVYLGFNDGAVAIQGDIGGEVLQVVPISSAPELGAYQSETSIQEYQGATPFLDRRIAQARVLGEAWNGHGLELAFDGLPDHTLVMSSVECEENKTGVHDALRIGTLKYMILSNRADG